MIFIALGIMLGAAAYIAISGILLGFREYLLDQMVNNDAHVRISAKARLVEEKSFDHVFARPNEKLFWIVPPSGRKDSQKIDNVQEWVQRLREDDDVEAYAPQLNVTALYRKGKVTQNGRVMGIIPSMQTRVAQLEKYVLKGTLRELAENGQKIMLGEGLRENLGLRYGDSVTVINSRGDTQQFKVSGSFSIGNRQIDESLAYVSLNTAQSIAGSPGQVSDIAVRLRDVFQVQDMLLGFAGGALGVLLGYLTCWQLSHVTFSSPMNKGKQTTMMVSFNYLIHLYGFLMALFSTTVASFLPALKAGKMSPIDIIRGQE
jgi:lipoprotein-releasing system permease protein